MSSGNAGPDRKGETADSATAVSSGDDSGVTVTGPIIRLNPQNGLFLRAEHLDAIQSYAQALSQATGVAVGSGVVYGFELAHQGGSLVATEGLAMTVTGQPLQSSGPARLPLDAAHLPALEQHGYWLLALQPASMTSGTENAYGTVCADPCEGAGRIQPWLQSLVVLRALPQVMPGLDEVSPEQRRNWLASRYFENERRASKPWVVPAAPGGTLAPLLANPWGQGGAAPDPVATTVPIGVLQRIGDEFVLDIWTARRELSGPPGAVRWSGHLGMRPWSVFLAQVLQFEDQLGASGIRGGSPVSKLVVDPKDEILEKFFADHPVTSPVGRLHDVRDLKTRLQAAPQPYLLEDDVSTLPGLGFRELPPAGYLAPIATDDHGRAQVTRLFAGTVTLRFCDVRADYVAGAVQAAQHLDRIPLNPDTNPLPEVDILVPSRPADLESLYTPLYGWVAFVRRSASSCEETAPDEPDDTDEVEIAYSVSEKEQGVVLFGQGIHPQASPLAFVTYPKDVAKLPAGIAKPGDLDQAVLVGVVAASTGAAEALTKARAEGVLEGWQLGNLTIDSAVHASFARPVIMIFVQAKVI